MMDGAMAGDLEPVMGELNGQAHDLLLHVLQIDVVACELLSYLNVEDIKALICGGSKPILKAVRNNREFLSRVQLQISSDVTGSSPEQTALLDLNWKHLAVDLSSPASLEGAGIRSVLGSAESLYLYMEYEDGILRLDHEQDQIITQYLEEILGKSGNLKSISIEEGLLYKIKPDIWSKETVRESLGPLRSIEKCCFRTPVGKAKNFSDGLSNSDIEVLWENLHQLALIPEQLRRFKYNDSERMHSPRTGHLQFIRNNLSTWEHLEFAAMDINSSEFSPAMSLKCPNLTSLTMSIPCTGNQKMVDALLNQLPPLRKVNISSILLVGPFPRSILSTIQQPHVLSKLEALHLGANRFSDLADRVDWTFLESMPRLKDLSIRIRLHNSTYHERVGGIADAEDILAWIPSQVEKLTLRGFGKYFWRHFPRRFMNMNVGDALAQFKNLRELNLLLNTGVVTDNGLQSIIVNCSKLTSLAISGGRYGFTDYGLTGLNKVTQEKTGVSLGQIKGLVHLTIMSSPNARPSGIIPALKFEFLRSFEYEPNNQLKEPADFLVQLARNNPSLERVILHVTVKRHDCKYKFFEREHLAPLKELVWQVNPRLRSIDFRDDGYCNSEVESEDEEEEEEDEDEDFENVVLDNENLSEDDDDDIDEDEGDTDGGSSISMEDNVVGENVEGDSDDDSVE